MYYVLAYPGHACIGPPHSPRPARTRARTIARTTDVRLDSDQNLASRAFVFDPETPWARAKGRTSGQADGYKIHFDQTVRLYYLVQLRDQSSPKPPPLAMSLRACRSWRSRAARQLARPGPSRTQSGWSDEIVPQSSWRGSGSRDRRP